MITLRGFSLCHVPMFVFVFFWIYHVFSTLWWNCLNEMRWVSWVLGEVTPWHPMACHGLKNHKWITHSAVCTAVCTAENTRPSKSCQEDLLMVLLCLCYVYCVHIVLDVVVMFVLCILCTHCISCCCYVCLMYIVYTLC